MIYETGAHAPILLPGVNGKIYVAILFATYWRIVTMNTVMHSYCTFILRCTNGNRCFPESGIKHSLCKLSKT